MLGPHPQMAVETQVSEILRTTAGWAKAKKLVGRET